MPFSSYLLSASQTHLEKRVVFPRGMVSGIEAHVGLPSATMEQWSKVFLPQPAASDCAAVHTPSGITGFELSREPRNRAETSLTAVEAVSARVQVAHALGAGEAVCASRLHLRDRLCTSDEESENEKLIVPKSEDEKLIDSNLESSVVLVAHELLVRHVLPHAPALVLVEASLESLLDMTETGKNQVRKQANSPQAPAQRTRTVRLLWQTRITFLSHENNT